VVSATCCGCTARVATNSVKAVRKPRQRSRRVRPLAPITVETIRTSLGLRDATAAEAIRRAREEVLGPNVRSLYARTFKAEVPERDWLYD
jgi:hypothetical protein